MKLPSFKVGTKSKFNLAFSIFLRFFFFCIKKVSFCGLVIIFCSGPVLTGIPTVFLFFQALAHVQSWRGKKQISAGKLLVELWKNEESNMGVTRDKTGKMAGKYYLLF